MRLKIEEPTRFSLCRLLQFPGGRRNAGDTCPGLKPASREMTKLDPVTARTGLSRRNFAPRCTSAVAVDCSQGGHFIDRIWAPFSPRTQTAIVFVPNHFATKSTHDWLTFNIDYLFQSPETNGRKNTKRRHSLLIGNLNFSTQSKNWIDLERLSWNCNVSNYLVFK